MDGVWLGIYVAAMAALGAAGASLAAERQRRALSETWGLVSVLGAGMLGYVLFLLALLGVRPARWPLVVICVVVGGTLLWRKRKIHLKPSLPALTRSHWRRYIVTGGLIGVLIALHGLVLVYALGYPLHTWDAYAIWGLKAKVIAAEGLMPQPGYFTDVSLSYSHLDYPLMTPLLMSGVFGALGHIDEQMAKLYLPVMYFGLTCLMYAIGRRRLPQTTALAVTVVVMGTPAMLRWSASGAADMPLAAFHAASVVYLLAWDEELCWRACVLCAVMSAFAAFTKNEGLALAAINAAVFVLLAIRGPHRRRRLAAAGVFIAVVVVMYLPWFLWSAEIPRTHENYLAHLRPSQIVDNATRAGIIAAEFARQIVSVNRYGLLWPLLIASALTGWRAMKDRSALIAWSLLLLHLGVYALVFMITPWDVREQLAVTLDRLIVHMIPVGGLILVLHLQPFWRAEGSAMKAR